MNNQFFGDERDFYKYGLLRNFAAGGFKVGVCWLLTHDRKKGGGKLEYLEKQDLRDKDEDLFDFLDCQVRQKQKRNVRLLKKKTLIQEGTYFPNPFSIAKEKRRKYFGKMIHRFERTPRDILFFDPDTGIRPRSKPKRENEYISYEELARCSKELERTSLMIFQYYRFDFSSEPIKRLHKEKSENLRKMDQNAQVCAIWKKPTAYYFLIRKEHAELGRAIEDAARHFGFEIVSEKGA